MNACPKVNYEARQTRAGSPRHAAKRLPELRTLLRLEMGLWAAVLLGVNWPLVHGICNSALIFLPGAVGAGESWRVLTHPFVHVTWYHLLLDGSAFFLLYHDLGAQPAWKRIAYVVASAAGSLLLPLVTDPTIAVKGLCGLSGIGHGLMVISALESMKSGNDALVRRIGLVSLLLVIAKSLFEALTGKILFGFLYFGLVGDPVATTHAGGALGALLAWLVFSQCSELFTPRSCLLRGTEVQKVQMAE